MPFFFKLGIVCVFASKFHMHEPDDSLVELVLSFNLYVGSRSQTEAARRLPSTWSPSLAFSKRVFSEALLR